MSVVKFYPQDSAKNPDLVLEQSIGLTDDVLVLGWDKDGELFALSSERFADGGELLWLIELFKARLLAGEYGDA